MGFLLRRSWNNRGGADPAAWEKPVNQASKWLVAKSGSQRIDGEGGSFSISNSESRRFVLSVFVGNGGTCHLGGSSGSNTIQISRTGQEITVTAQPNSGSAVTRTAVTEMPPDMWTNVYVQCVVSGALSNQVTVSFSVDFLSYQQMIATGDLFGNSFPTNGKTLACNSLAGWCWFADARRGFFGWGASTTIPITDAKYREAVLNNATWDVDTNTTLHTWYMPDGARYMRAWLIQGGGGSGGDGADGSPGSPGQSGSSGVNGQGCTAGTSGTNGTGGGSGGRGGNEGSAGSAGSPGGLGGPGGSPTSSSTPNLDGPGFTYTCTPGSGGSAGAAGSGGKGGAGGRGVIMQMTTTQREMPLRAGAKGARGGTGGRGGDGLHTLFGDISTIMAMPYSTGRSPASLSFGKTTFEHGVGGSDQNGGVVFYIQW